MNARSPERIAIDTAIGLGLLIIFVILIAALVQPFLSVLIWAVILTVTLFPVFAWIRTLTGGRGIVAAALVTVLSLALILGPIGFLSASFVESALRHAAAVRDRTLDLSALPFDLSTLPVVGSRIEDAWAQVTSDADGFLEHYAHTMLVSSEWLLEIVSRLAGSTLVFALAILASGFLFVPGPRLVDALHDIAAKIMGPKGKEFVALGTATIRSVSRGIVGVAALQALLFGSVLLIFGVPHAGLLTIILLIFAVFQIGSVFLILPLVVWLWIAREPSGALIFAASMLPVLAIEHLLKPVVLAHGIKTPTLIIALGVLGGLLAFGLKGLFIGPVALAVFYELVVFWVWPDRIADDT